MTEVLAAALVAGFVGSSHCIGMCGGISAALGMATAGPRAGGGRSLGLALAYNGARIASYGVAGAIAAGVGMAIGAGSPWLTLAFRALAGVVLVAIGLQIAFEWRLLRPLESAGAKVWQRLSPAAGGLARRGGIVGALGLGALWGWLPCGLVYGMLLTAAGSGGPVEGAAIMFAFGLGTAPAMILTGTAGTRLLLLRRRRDFRLVAGLMVAGMGIWTLLGPLPMLSGGMATGHH